VKQAKVVRKATPLLALELLHTSDVNAFSVDVEDYFHVTAFARPHAAWDTFPSRVEANTERVLDLLRDSHFTATFFVLGWVAEHFPQLVRRIAAEGHEVACHSHLHRKIYELSQDEFRSDTLRAKNYIEDACGQAVRGYRAPSFSIRKDSSWALGILAELGFAYDSSIFPVVHPDYGVPLAPRAPFRVNTSSGSIVEFPMTTLDWHGFRSPVGGGAYLRFLPYAFTRWSIKFINQQEGTPASVYIHPWELDPDQPRIANGATSKLRHYTGLSKATKKVRSLLEDFRFCSMKQILDHLSASDLSCHDLAMLF
jgi:polysaccharide deacetylase family protein (PEP-CTERM system associated)